MMRSIVLDESRLGLVCGRRGRGSYAASIRRKLEGNDDTEEPLEEEDWDGFEPDDDPLELTTISTSWKTDGPASGLQANGGSRSVGAFERVAQALDDDLLSIRTARRDAGCCRAGTRPASSWVRQRTDPGTHQRRPAT